MSADTFRFQVGEFSCLVLNDATARYPIGMFLTNPPPLEDRERLGLSRDCTEQVEMSYNCLLVDTGRGRVLIDTGFGSPGGKLHQILRSHGIDERAIGTVVLTHAHPDHIGGVIAENGSPAFPAARHVMFQEEWDYWSAEPSLKELNIDESIRRWIQNVARAGLSTLRGRVELLQRDTEILPGISAMAAFGHSPGHMVVEVSSAGRHLLFAADTILLPFNLPYPEARGATDHQPDIAVTTRLRLLDHAAKSRCLVGVSHFAFPGLGYVLPDDRRWKWQPLG